MHEYHKKALNNNNSNSNNNTENSTFTLKHQILTSKQSRLHSSSLAAHVAMVLFVLGPSEAGSWPVLVLQHMLGKNMFLNKRGTGNGKVQV